MRPISKTWPEAIVSVKRPASPSSKASPARPGLLKRESPSAPTRADVTGEDLEGMGGNRAGPSETRRRELRGLGLTGPAPDAPEGGELLGPEPFGFLEAGLERAIGAGVRLSDATRASKAGWVSSTRPARRRLRNAGHRRGTQARALASSLARRGLSLRRSMTRPR